jgi:hypothetical protein
MSAKINGQTVKFIEPIQIISILVNIFEVIPCAFLQILISISLLQKNHIELKIKEKNLEIFGEIGLQF